MKKLLLCLVWVALLAGCAAPSVKSPPSDKSPAAQPETGGPIGLINVVDRRVSVPTYGLTPASNSFDSMDAGLKLREAVGDLLADALDADLKPLEAPAWTEDSDADLSGPTETNGDLRDAFKEAMAELCTANALAGLLLVRSPDALYTVLEEERNLPGYGLLRVHTPVGTRSAAYARLEGVYMLCKQPTRVQRFDIQESSSLIPGQDGDNTDLTDKEQNLLKEYLLPLATSFAATAKRRIEVSVLAEP